MQGADVNTDGVISFGSISSSLLFLGLAHAAPLSFADEFVTVCKKFPNLLFPVFSITKHVDTYLTRSPI